MNDLLESLEFTDALGQTEGSKFTELHTRIVDRPVAEVWPHCLAVTAAEIRTLGPLMKLRGLPARLLGRAAPEADAPEPLLDVFTEAEFVLLRRDTAPGVDGRAVVIFGAAGKFWSPSGNHPISVDSPQEFIDFTEPGFAKTIARLAAIDLGDGTTRLETETWVAGTNTAASRLFAPYWALIRLPSGLIRRSWLAAIERRLIAEGPAA